MRTSSLVFLEYLTTAFDSIADLVVLIGVEPKGAFRLLLANKPTFTVTGYPEDSVGKTIAEITDKPLTAFLTRKYQEVVDTRQTVEYSSWLDLPAGKRAFAVRLIPILSAVGEVAQIVAIARDTTELMQLQKEVERLRARRVVDAAT